MHALRKHLLSSVISTYYYYRVCANEQFTKPKAELLDMKMKDIVTKVNEIPIGDEQKYLVFEVC